MLFSSADSAQKVEGVPEIWLFVLMILSTAYFFSGEFSK